MAKEQRDFAIGKVDDRLIETEMKESYLNYAMSVIVSRALPDVRDGLKPVHRRILFSMGETGMWHNVKFKKSAEIVGNVMGLYHPHGDAAIYDTMARMAQPWSLRYMMVDGQGNFGSIDGDSPAAMRYTEARMTAIAEEMLADIDKDTIDFHNNYSDTKKEPDVLPAKVPQLLMNGTVGIAVGMATNIPPHNLGELMDAVKLLIEKEDASIDELMHHVKGPDFPTGGLIFNPGEIKTAYETGRGGIVMRGVAVVEENSNGNQIIITELPYQVNKADLVVKIAELVKMKKLIGISDLRDESDRKGIRISVDLKKEAYPKKILNQLFKLTPLQSTFHVNLLALTDGIQPHVFNLRTALIEFVKHRRVVVTRRTQFELKKAEERLHILEGLKIALDHLDAVIKTIRGSATKEDAHGNLMKQFKLSELQASAILEMRLSALAGLERKKVEDEYAEKKNLIAALKAILGDPKKIDAIIIGECDEMKEKFGDKRRTEVSGHQVGAFTDMDLIPNEEVVVTMTMGNYIKRQQLGEYRIQRRGGKGVIGMTTKEEDQISTIQVCKNHDDILFFTNKGRVFRQKVFEIPQASRIARGTSTVNLIQLAPEEKVTTILTLPEVGENEDLVMVTDAGVVKKTAIKAYTNIRANGLIAIKLDEGDELTFVRRSQPGDEIMIVTKMGQSIRFKESDARPLGRSTRGVRAIKLKTGDEVVGADVARKGVPMNLLVISENGQGKQTLLSQYNLQHRGGSGVKTMNVTAKTGKLIGAKLMVRNADAEMILTSKDGQIIRMPFKGVPTLGRSTQGVRVMRLRDNDKVASFTVLVMETADGGIINPNEDLDGDQVEELAEQMESEVREDTQAKPTSKLKIKNEKLKKEIRKPIAKKAPVKTVAKKPAAKTPVKGFTARKITGKTTKAVAKPKAKTTGFTARKITGKTTKPKSNSFTRRKLK